MEFIRMFRCRCKKEKMMTFNHKLDQSDEILANFLNKRPGITIHIHGHIHQSGGQNQHSGSRVTYNVAKRTMLIDFTTLNKN